MHHGSERSAWKYKAFWPKSNVFIYIYRYIYGVRAGRRRKWGKKLGNVKWFKFHRIHSRENVVFMCVFLTFALEMDIIHISTDNRIIKYLYLWMNTFKDIFAQSTDIRSHCARHKYRLSVQKFWMENFNIFVRCDLICSQN